jgi:hypothetical protein
VSDEKIGNKPVDRLTRIANRLTNAWAEDPEYEESDKCIIFLDDNIKGGICISGYDSEAEAMADLLIHMQAIMKASGKSMDIMFLGEDGVQHFVGDP